MLYIQVLTVFAMRNMSIHNYYLYTFMLHTTLCYNSCATGTVMETGVYLYSVAYSLGGDRCMSVFCSVPIILTGWRPVYVCTL